VHNKMQVEYNYTGAKVYNSPKQGLNVVSLIQASIFDRTAVWALRPVQPYESSPSSLIRRRREDLR